MKSISEIWRSLLCLGRRPPSTPPEENPILPEEAAGDPNAITSSTGEEPWRAAPPQPTLSLESYSTMQAPDQQTQTPNVVIFMPPPPMIHWPPHRSAANEARSAPVRANSSLPQPEYVSESTPNPPVSAELPARSVTPPPPPQTKEEYVEYAETFVTNNIEHFGKVTEESVKTIAERAAAQADIIAEELGLRPETTAELVKLAFYDFVILCDDSGSMNSPPQHIPALNDTLRRVAHIATILQPKGISIRFLNYDEGDGREYDDLVDEHDIATKVARVPYYGMTRLGQVLNDKIVYPKIINKLLSGTLERPVFVVIITDGQPSAEPPESLRHTIRNCKDILDRQSYKGAAVIFLISQIGSDAAATTFLRSLETDPQISSMVFCSTENLAAKLAQFQNSLQDKQYTAWLVDLFLAALDKQTKHS